MHCWKTVSTEIYYFSGTGNSLHVARELQKRLPDAELVPILSLEGKGAVRASAAGFAHDTENAQRDAHSTLEKERIRT
jgi:hypothetical protein